LIPPEPTGEDFQAYVKSFRVIAREGGQSRAASRKSSSGHLSCRALEKIAWITRASRVMTLLILT
jgi:hypothetical protein